MGSLALEASTDNGATWSSIWSKSGNQGNAWLTATLDLGSYVGGTVQFRFNGITGTTWQGDMAVDALDINTGTSGGGTCEATTLSITFDNYPEETSWDIKDSNGTVVFSGGTYASQADGSTLNIPLCVDTGCYTFTIYDSYGDGICCSYGNGSYTYTKDSDGTVLASGASFTSSDATDFCVGTAAFAQFTAVEPVNIADVVMYPNPVSSFLTVQLKDKNMTSYAITNLMGQKVIIGQLSSTSINVSQLEAGVYIIEFSSDKKSLFWSGFFIGLFWFYWIGFSFRYYDALYLIPLMMLFVSLGYGIIFWAIGIFKNPLPRVILFTLLSYLHPLSFNWFIPELTLLDTLFGIQKWQFGLFLLSIALFIELRSWYKSIALLALLASINYNSHQPL
jgi:hypothetical protein